MAGTLLDIDLDASVLQQELARMENRLDHLEDAMDDIGTSLADSARERFHASRGPDGQPWRALNPLYAQSKAAMGARSDNILVFGGHLHESIVYAIGLDRTSVEVGTQMVYGAIHQFGGVIRAKNGHGLHFTMGFVEGSGDADGNNRELRHHVVQSVTIPARPYLGLSPEDEGEVVALLRDHIAPA